MEDPAMSERETHHPAVVDEPAPGLPEQCLQRLPTGSTGRAMPAAGKIRASLKALEADEAQVRKTLTSLTSTGRCRAVAERRS
jgi:hypothetical protein